MAQPKTAMTEDKLGTLRVKLRFHAAQRQIFSDPARFKVVEAGRRFGKTVGAVQWLARETLRKPGQLGWWVSPTYKQAKIAFRYFVKLFRKTGILAGPPNRSDLICHLVLGCRVEFRSAEIPDNLRGEGIAALVLDESGSITDVAWTEVLRPTLMDSKGQVVFIGTPKGQNWFDDLWKKGAADGKVWKSWRFSSYDNPLLDKAEIQAAEAELPEDVARQEIHGIALETGGSVFRNVDACATATVEEPRPGEAYQLGVDLAKYQDFTVIAVRCRDRLVYLERFNKIDWRLQRQRIKHTAKRYNNAQVLVDSTGVGDPNYEELVYEGLRVKPYQFTYVSKKELVDNLILKFDKREIQILRDPVLLAELKAYAYELTSGGKLRTNAPVGKHDDCVIALALAFREVRTAVDTMIAFYKDEAKTQVAARPDDMQPVRISRADWERDHSW